MKRMRKQLHLIFDYSELKMLDDILPEYKHHLLSVLMDCIEKFLHRLNRSSP